jgi:hypothetical protein
LLHEVIHLKRSCSRRFPRLLLRTQRWPPLLQSQLSNGIARVSAKFKSISVHSPSCNCIPTQHSSHRFLIITRCSRSSSCPCSCRGRLPELCPSTRPIVDQSHSFRGSGSKICDYWASSSSSACLTSTRRPAVRPSSLLASMIAATVVEPSSTTSARSVPSP